MPAALDASEIALPSSEIAPTRRDYSHLKAYQFKPGQRPPIGVGRPKGSKNALTLLKASAHPLVRKYIARALDDRFKDQGAMLRHAVETITDEDKGVVPSSLTIVVIEALHEARENNVL